jgi:transcriptional regulator with XRE-family HTH domain
MSEHALRVFRRQHRLSQESVASAVGLSIASISRIETGRQTPTLGVVAKLVTFTAGFDGAALTVDAFLKALTCID